MSETDHANQSWDRQDLPCRPLLKPWYRRIQEGERLVFEYGGSVVALSGRAVPSLLARLVPLLDGGRTISEIVGLFDARVAPAVIHALHQLDDNDLLLEAFAPAVEKGDRIASGIEEAAFALAAAVPALTAAEALERMSGATVSVIGSSEVADQIHELLTRAGIGKSLRRSLDDEDSAFDRLDLLVVAPDPDECLALRDWNSRALSTGWSWELVLPYDGSSCIVGPIFRPKETCCYECYRIRRSHTSHYSGDFWLLEKTALAARQPPWLDSVVAGVAVNEALKWIVAQHSTPGSFCAIEHFDWIKITSGTVFRVPRCPACSGLLEQGVTSLWYEGEFHRDISA